MKTLKEKELFLRISALAFLLTASNVSADAIRLLCVFPQNEETIEGYDLTFDPKNGDAAATVFFGFPNDRTRTEEIQGTYSGSTKTVGKVYQLYFKRFAQSYTSTAITVEETIVIDRVTLDATKTILAGGAVVKKNSICERIEVEDYSI